MAPAEMDITTGDSREGFIYTGKVELEARHNGVGSHRRSSLRPDLGATGPLKACTSGAAAGAPLPPALPPQVQRQ